MASQEEDVELTAEEAKQLEKAFKDEDFRRIMADYAAEISDPKHKEEQEAYISQLEKQNEVPEGKALVWPSSGFVVKCVHKKTREGNSEESKLFLNFVHSDKIDEPTMSKVDSTGANWSVPHAIGPMRMESDKSGNLVPTFDACFHPLSLRHAHGRKEFLDLIVDAAKDAVCASFQASGDKVEILSGHAILRGVSYKTGTPKALLVSTNSGADEPTKSVKRSEAASADTAKVQVTKVEATNGPIVPTYKIVEQGVFDIAEHTTVASGPKTRRPKQLRVCINVDEATSAGNINLDVSEKELVIKPNDFCPYKLNLQLPYPVNSSKGNAQFDKKQKTLVVTLPVVP